MSEAISIRVAEVQDAESIAEAEYTTAATRGLLNALPGEIPLEAFREKIRALAAHPDGIYLVAQSGGQLVGHLLLDPMPLSQNSHICTLTIVVHPGHTARGTGRQMLDHAIAWARAHERLEKIELRVRAGNERALRLYRSCGFVQEGSSRRRLKYGDGEYEDDLMMGLLL